MMPNTCIYIIWAHISDNNIIELDEFSGCWIKLAVCPLGGLQVAVSPKNKDKHTIRIIPVVITWLERMTTRKRGKL